MPSKSAAADVCGVSTEQLNKWIKGVVKVPVDALYALSLAADADFNWLISGKGSTLDRISAPGISRHFSAAQQAMHGFAEEEALVFARDFPPSFSLVPRLDVQASAGSGAIGYGEDPLDYLAFRTEWLRGRGINPNAARILTVRGDSMEETIRDGDVLLVDTSIDQVKDNAIYVLVLSSAVLVKRVHLRANGTVQLISDNPRYAPEEISASDVEMLNIAGRVMWFGRSI